MGTVTFLFVGRLGTSVVNGAAIGSSIGNLTCWALGLGMLSALDALCSQAFGGKQYKLVGLHCQRGMIIITLFCIPQIIIWLNTYYIAKLMGMPDETALYAAKWNKLQIFG